MNVTLLVDYFRTPSPWGWYVGCHGGIAARLKTDLKCLTDHSMTMQIS